jgi:signal transduction histidine kinase
MPPTLPPANCLDDLETERDDALATLSAVTRLFAIGAESASVNDAAHLIAEAVRGELAAEACAVCLHGGPDELTMIGFATQAARLGSAPDVAATTGLVALGRLAAVGAEPRCFVVAPDGGFAPIAFDALAGAGAVVLPFAAGDGGAGVVLARWLIAPPMRTGRAAKMRLIATAVGQALGVVSDREGRARVVASLERELGTRESERRASTTQVEHLTSELVRASKVKQLFLATMSHELRTPLNIILGFSELLRDGQAGALLPAQSELLDGVLRSSRNLHALIDDILFYVECECDRVHVVREVLSTRELVDEALAALPAPADAKRVSLRVQIAAAASWLRVDAKLARRMLFHLLQNAFKFTSAGSVDLSVAESDDGTIVIAVRDTGAGIPSEQLAAIFEAFTQGDGSSTRRFEGIGLGLTLVHRCARLLGGTVRVESAVGAGTTVRVTLPWAAVAADAAPAGRTALFTQPTDATES